MSKGFFELDRIALGFFTQTEQVSLPVDHALHKILPCLVILDT